MKRELKTYYYTLQNMDDFKSFKATSKEIAIENFKAICIRANEVGELLDEKEWLIFVFRFKGYYDDIDYSFANYNESAMEMIDFIVSRLEPETRWSLPAGVQWIREFDDYHKMIFPVIKKKFPELCVIEMGSQGAYYCRDRDSLKRAESLIKDKQKEAQDIWYALNGKKTTFQII